MSKRNGKDRNELETRLFLEKAPSAENQGEFDEIVPEFMHRAFYRSTEDEFQAVEPSERLRAVRSVPQSRPLRRQVALPPLPPMSPPEAPEPLPALQPLRSHSGQVASEAVTSPSLSLDEDVTPSRPPEALRQPTVLPRPVKTSSLNLPLVACLLFVVGLLLWREQTRPVFEAEAALPLPSAVTVREETEPTLGREAPSPGVNSEPEDAVPVLGPEQPMAEPVEQNSSVLSEAEQGAAALESDESAEGESSLFPSQGASARRAAILNRVDEGLSSGEESTTLPEPEAPPSRTQPAPAASSLFPSTTPSRPAAPASAPASPESKPALPSQPAASASTTSLFPAEHSRPSVPEPPKPLQLSPQPPKPHPGEPYQIAEPSL